MRYGQSAMGHEKKNALVTGAASGIGAAIAGYLGARGYRVLVNFRSNEAGAAEVAGKILAAGGEALPMQGDVASRADVERIFQTFEKQFGFFDYLVNNAGVTHDAPLMLMTDSQWDLVMDANLRSTYICSQLALRGMMHIGGGAITNIVSPSGIRGQAGQCNYSAAKGGVIAFTKALAREMGRFNIRVNAVCPGVIETRMAAPFIQKEGKNLLAQIPLARFGKPEEVASLAGFLGSEQAGYITGQVIAVDGGLL
jgi:3-oxoacyl-[acyl-carrier protein] reductase